MSDEEVDDLVDAWHHGGWPDQSLEEVIRRETGWSSEQFEHWSTHGRPDTDG